MDLLRCKNKFSIYLEKSRHMDIINSIDFEGYKYLLKVKFSNSLGPTETAEFVQSHHILLVFIPQLPYHSAVNP